MWTPQIYSYFTCIPEHSTLQRIESVVDIKMIDQNPTRGMIRSLSTVGVSTTVSKKESPRKQPNTVQQPQNQSTNLQNSNRSSSPRSSKSTDAPQSNSSSPENRIVRSYSSPPASPSKSRNSKTNSSVCTIL